MANNSEKPIWYCRCNTDAANWEAHSDVDSQIIEDAYRSDKRTVKIKNYMIDFQSNLQINMKDPKDIRSIRREFASKISTADNCLRAQRFFLEEPNFTKSFDEVTEKGSKFIADWEENTLSNDSGLRNDASGNSLLKRCADLAVHGIILEGIRLGYHDAANRLSAELENAGAELLQVCVKLYTKESFLYPLINKTLREKDFSKLSTFGPYAYLLHKLLIESNLMVYNTTVYRGAFLSTEMIDQYKSSEGEIAKWLGFSSTSRNLRKTENWRGSNTLFIIEIKQEPHPFDCGYDISGLSDFPQEEEVLLLAGGRFKIEKVDFDDTQKKHIIHLIIF